LLMSLAFNALLLGGRITATAMAVTFTATAAAKRHGCSKTASVAMATATASAKIHGRGATAATSVAVTAAATGLSGRGRAAAVLMRVATATAMAATGPRICRGRNRQRGYARGENQPGHWKNSFRTKKTVRSLHRSIA